MRPTIHYEEALAHAGDRIRFAPGARASVPFRPRSDDRWLVGGERPRALPGGRLGGRDLVDGSGDSVAAVAEGGAAPEATTPRAAALPSNGLHRAVYGFLPYWELSDAVLDYRSLSTIAYFGVGAAGSGDLVKRDAEGRLTTGWAGWTSSRMTTILDAAHRAGTRVVLTVQRFSWTTSSSAETVALLSSPTARSRLARQIAAAVRDRGADGVNLDFEPIPTDQTAHFTALVRRVRAELDAVAPGYELVFDATGYIGRYDIKALTAPGAADAVFIMGYDYRTGSASTAGSIAPLSGPAYDVTDTINAYLARTQASKIILGVPYYGRAWSTVDDQPNSSTRPQGGTYGYSATAVYTTALGLVADNGALYDTNEQVAWSLYRRQACSTCPWTWRQLYFDDERALAAKYDLVNARGLRGAGIWALGYEGTGTGLPTLLRAKFGTDVTPPLAGIRTLPARSLEEGIRVEWTGRDELTGIRSYDAQVSVDGGAWQPWLTGTTRRGASYLGRNGHRYAFRVRAVDAKGNRGAWDQDQGWIAAPSLSVGGFGRVVVPSLSIRNGPGISATKLGSLASGDIVAVVDGPRAADGYDWYKVRAPIREWSPVSYGTLRDVWVAAGSTASRFLAARQAPNATGIDAVISDFSATATGPPLGSDAAARPPRAFSPNGDGRFDRLRLAYHLDRAVDSLVLRVYRASDLRLVGTATLPRIGAGDQVWLWDGATTTGRVQDGEILLQLRATDAGTSYSAPAADMTDPALGLAELTVRVDTVAPKITSIGVAPGSFSPDGDGDRDVTVFKGAADEASGGWIAELVGPSGIVRRWRDSGTTPRVSWDGRDAAGVLVADGGYTFRLAVFDELGNRRAARSTVRVDTLAPTGSLAIGPVGGSSGGTLNAFSPDGDGAADRVRIAWSLSELAGVRLQVLDGDRLVHAAARARATGGAVTWDGRDDADRQLPAGRYRVVVAARDPSGNERSIGGSVVITRTAGFLRTAPWLWYPMDGDALATHGRVRFRLTAQATVRLELLDARGRITRVAWSGRTLGAGRHEWIWQGRLANGAYAAAGSYRTRLTVTRGGVRQVLLHGLRLEAFSISVPTPELRPGSTIRVIARSAEPLRSAPVLSFSQPGSTVQRRVAWHRQDGRWQATFTVRSARGPATISASAMDSAGGRNRSSRIVPVRPATGL